MPELAVTTEHRMKEEQVEDQTAIRIFDKLEELQAAMNFSKGVVAVIVLSQSMVCILLGWMLMSILDWRESKVVIDYRLARIEEVQNAKD